MVSEKELEELKSRLKEEFSGYYELAGGKNFRYYHLLRVHKYARKLMQKPGIQSLDFDREAVEIAALFHDIGRAEDIEDGYLDPIKEHEGHAKKGAEIIDDYISDMVSPETLEKVREVIRTHHSSPGTVEAKIVQDADLLDKYGVHNLWRKIHYSADREETLDEALEYFWSSMMERNEQKLEDFNFDAARKVARNRLKHFKQVMETVEEQVEAEDI